MTSKAYLVSWLGKGNIVWTPLEESGDGGYVVQTLAEVPMRHLVDVAASNPDIATSLFKVGDSGLTAVNAIQSTVNLTAGLSIIAVGLQLTTLTNTLRVLQKVREVDRKVSVINGKFEMHFLDRSLDFCLQAHQGVTGLIPPVMASLEEDCYNAMQAIVAMDDLQIPAYLRFKLTTQAQAIESWNQLMYSVLHNGACPQVSPERLARWVKQTNPTTKSLPPGGYASQAQILAAWEECLDSSVKGSNLVEKIFKSDGRPLLAKALSKGNFERAYPVILLAREIQNALSFSEALEEKIKGENFQPLLIKAAS